MAKRDHDESLARAVDACLPQTQCGECGFAGCLPYARAIVAGKIGIDRCPPGGIATATALAKLTGGGLVPAYSPPKAQRSPALPAFLPPQPVARINEELCIGCTKCLPACPVDAIIGASKQMHSVIPEFCTGCGLCLEPCPMDCIDLAIKP
ncbi:MAG: RnfABCDGE type electron transport complex subunit B [Candidatus Eutrophobiaceae bacterium]